MAGEKLAALAQAFLVDAVADAGRDVPFGRNAERGEALRGVKQRLHRDQMSCRHAPAAPAAGCDLGGECPASMSSGTTSMPE